MSALEESRPTWDEGIHAHLNSLECKEIAAVVCSLATAVGTTALMRQPGSNINSFRWFPASRKLTIILFSYLYNFHILFHHIISCMLIDLKVQIPSSFNFEYLFICYLHLVFPYSFLLLCRYASSSLFGYSMSIPLSLF